MSNDALNVDINQQLVLVTGGARGLGEEITKSVLAHGGSVVINYYRSRERAQAIADAHPGKAWAIQADVTDRASVDGLFAEAERSARRPITSVVNNALVDFSFDGDARPKAEDIKFERFDQQFRGAVGGTLNVIQAALDGFDRNGGGRIVNIGTNLFQNPVVPYHDYTAAKAALLSLTRTFAADLGAEERHRQHGLRRFAACDGRQCRDSRGGVRWYRGRYAARPCDHDRRIRRCGTAVPEPVVSRGDRPEPRGRWRTRQGLTSS